MNYSSHVQLSVRLTRGSTTVSTIYIATRVGLLSNEFTARKSNYIYIYISYYEHISFSRASSFQTQSTVFLSLYSNCAEDN